MQVTNVQDHVTHAVIGANQAHAFGISDSAAFFRVLSASLYSNKPLAVVREILCNAWDAHVEGKVDRAVEVTLNRQQLIIRDFGSGLSEQQIISNYTTYGGTTKVENEEVTGGFGLGSKAPFAYVDHFEVISWHDGLKTIWSMSLSSALVDGKPQVTKIVSIPCNADETGVQVSLKLKNEMDYSTFEKLVLRIAEFGEMKVKLNNTLCRTYPFSEAEHGFLIIDKAKMPMQSESRIWIRYGHVVYPLERHPDFKVEYEEAESFLKAINGQDRWGYGNNGTHWVLILQADPNTVSITPSRESLSLTDVTIENCRKLLEKFTDLTANGMDKECIEIVEKAIKAAWKMDPRPLGEMMKSNGRVPPGDLLRYERKLPNLRYFESISTPDCIRNMKECATNFLRLKNYPQSPRFLELDMDIRLDMLVKTNTLDKKWVHSYRAALKKSRRRSNPGQAYTSDNPWFYRKVVGPLLTILREHKTMKPDNLLAFTVDRWKSDLKCRPIKELGYTVTNLGDTLPWLRKIMILSHNRLDVLERAHLFPILKNFLGGPMNSFVYVVPRHQGRIEEARELFTKLGFNLIDLTKRHKWEPEKVLLPRNQPVVGETVVPRRKGLSKASNLLIHDKTRLCIKAGFKIGNPTLEKPEFVIQISPNRQDLPQIAGFSGDALTHLITLFGDRIGMAANAAQVERYRQAGAKVDLKAEVYATMLLEYQTDPKIEEHYRNYRAGDFQYHIDQILKTIRYDDILRSEYKLPNPISGSSLSYIKMFESLSRWTVDSDKQLLQIRKLIESWEASPELKAVTAKLEKNLLTDLVDVSDMYRYIVHGGPEKAKKARELLAFIMKG